MIVETLTTLDAEAVEIPTALATLGPAFRRLNANEARVLRGLLESRSGPVVQGFRRLPGLDRLRLAAIIVATIGPAPLQRRSGPSPAPRFGVFALDGRELSFVAAQDVPAKALIEHLGITGWPSAKKAAALARLHDRRALARNARLVVWAGGLSPIAIRQLVGDTAMGLFISTRREGQPTVRRRLPGSARVVLLTKAEDASLVGRLLTFEPGRVEHVVYAANVQVRAARLNQSIEHLSAPPKAQGLDVLLDMAIAFAEGFVDGLGRHGGIDTDSLTSLAWNLFSTDSAVATEAFARGVVSGCKDALADKVRFVQDLLSGKLVEQIAALIEQIMMQGREAAKKLGILLGERLGSDLQAILHMGGEQLWEQLGRVTGSFVVDLFVDFILGQAWDVAADLLPVGFRRDLGQLAARERNVLASDRRVRAAIPEHGVRPRATNPAPTAVPRRAGARRVIDDKRIVPASSTGVTISGSRQGLRRRATAAARVEGSPLWFLLTRTDAKGKGHFGNSTAKGVREVDWFIDPTLVEAGHLFSAHAGGDTVVLMAAWKNRMLSSTIESGGNVIDIVPRALVIDGILIDVDLVVDWFDARLIDESVLAAAVLVDLAK